MNHSSTMKYAISIRAVREISANYHSAIMYASGFATMIYAAFRYFQAKKSPLASIPTVGYSGVLTSYITAIKYISDGSALIQEGYEKFNGKPFKIATPARWIVVLGLPQHIQDLSVVSDEIASINKPTMEANQSKYIFGGELLEDPYHIATIRGPVTRNLANKFDDINDEVVHSLKEYIPPREDWTTVAAYDTLLHVMCRTINHFLLGPEMCRDSRYQNLSERLTLEILENAAMISRFPRVFRPIASIFFSRVKDTLKECRELLGPMITERLKRYQQKKYVPGKTEDVEDVVSWFIETSSQEYHRTVEDITRRVMMMNFASLHTSTMVLTHVIYDIVVHPEYVQELREEAEIVIAKYGWTKGGLQKLHKIDSFLKESHRINTLSHYLMIRETLKDFRLSDGTLIPAGAHVGIASGAINKSEKYYRDANSFKGLRFTEMQGDDGLDPVKYQMVSMSPYSVMFGHGRHACPGRFFAVTMIKTIFTHILMDYDVQLENSSMERPPDVQNGTSSAPNPYPKLRFRKRCSPRC